MLALFLYQNPPAATPMQNKLILRYLSRLCLIIKKLYGNACFHIACLFSLKFLLFLIFSLFSSLALSTTSMAAVQHHYFCGCLLCCHQPCALAGQNIRRRKQNHRHQPFQFFPFFQMKSPLLQISFLGHFMQQRGRLQLLLLPVTLPHLLHHARDSGFHPLLRRCHHRDNPAHFRNR